MTLRIVGPWTVKQSAKKKFSPNLNQYRNAHYQTLSKVKREYAKLIYPQLEGVEPLGKVVVTLVAYPPNKRLFDCDNLSPHMKFFLDALVTAEVLVDDNYTVVVRTLHEVGGIDKENPRVEFIVEEVDNMRPESDG